MIQHHFSPLDLDKLFFHVFIHCVVELHAAVHFFFFVFVGVANMHHNARFSKLNC